MLLEYSLVFPSSVYHLVSSVCSCIDTMFVRACLTDLMGRNINVPFVGSSASLIAYAVYAIRSSYMCAWCAWIIHTNVSVYYPWWCVAA